MSASALPAQPLPDPTDQRKRRLRRRLVVAAILTPLMMALVLGGLVIFDHLSADSVVDAFCAAMDDGNFAAAHDTLSDRAQSQVSVDQLAQLAGLNGSKNCSDGGICGGTDTSWSTATVNACFLEFDSLNGSHPSKGVVYLVRERLQWRIDRIDAPIYGLG
jgi:hypothetical protein